jgi:hypothetical protein
MAAPLISSGFLETLESFACFLNTEHVEWMVFGGAAMALLGYEQGPVRDIDIIISANAADALHSRFSWKNFADQSSRRFRSRFLLRPNFGPIPVELLGGFQIHTEVGWTAVQPLEGIKTPLGSQSIFLPTRNRLIEIFRLSGRPKDLNRAALLVEQPTSSGQD